MSRASDNETRSILPAFVGRQEWKGASWGSLSSLPPVPLIDRRMSVGVSLVELARMAKEAGR